MADIDIGSEAIVRDVGFTAGFTSINQSNPANASGIIDTVEIYANISLEGCRVGTFYTTNGNTLKCRDSVVIGAVAAGAKRTFSGLSIEVQVGDYIGMYWTYGKMWSAASGQGAGLWYKSGEYIDPGDEATYTDSGYEFSLYGTGGFAGPPTVTTQAVTDIERTTATGNGTIASVGLEDADKRGVCWNTTGNPTIADDKSEETDSFGTGAFTRPMTGLTPGQHYYVKAYAHNSDGYGYGDQVEFTTFLFPVVTTNPATREITCHTLAEQIVAILNGTLTEDGEEGAFDCGFQWGETEAYGYTTPTQSRTEGQTFDQTITELAPGVTYHFRAFATSTVGTIYGADRDFTYLSPSGIGDETNIPKGNEPHWHAVRHFCTDPGTSISRVYEFYTADYWYRDLYQIDSTDVCYWDSLHIKSRLQASWSGHSYRYALKMPGYEVWVSEVYACPALWAAGVDEELTTNPITGQAWQKSDLDSLQLGISLFGNSSYLGDPRCGLLYIELENTSYVPIVTTNPATGQGAIAATLNGTLDADGGEVCQCGFEWGLDIGYGTVTPTQSKNTGETFSQVIGGLVPNTTYHFRAFATNSAGTGYGADRSFTTALIISRAFALGREEL